MIIIIGPSATGKTEIVKVLEKEYGYKKLVTYTSRDMRPLEIEGRDYHFIPKDIFKDKIDNGFFFEFIEYNGNYYGTAKEDITDDKVVILEPNGFKAYHSSNLNHLVSFFLDSSKEKRIERMGIRKDSIEKIKERIKSDEIIFDLKNIEGLDFILDSDSLTIGEMSKEINDLYKIKLANEK